MLFKGWALNAVLCTQVFKNALSVFNLRNFKEMGSQKAWESTSQKFQFWFLELNVNSPNLLIFSQGKSHLRDASKFGKFSSVPPDSGKYLFLPFVSYLYRQENE